jgi:ribosomal protein L12E/L44/L45/RPP1/RPP2
LASDGVEVYHVRWFPHTHQYFLLQSDKIITLTTAAGVPREAIWVTLLAKALKGKNVKELRGLEEGVRVIGRR